MNTNLPKRFSKRLAFSMHSAWTALLEADAALLPKYAAHVQASVDSPNQHIAIEVILGVLEAVM